MTTSVWTTPTAIAAEFGLHPGTVRRMALSGKFPHGSVVKIGTALRLDRETILESLFVKAQKKG